MTKLYDLINNLPDLTKNLKEEKIINKVSPTVKDIAIIYEKGVIHIPLSEIKAFNFYDIDNSGVDKIGYICFNLDKIVLREFTLDYLSNNIIQYVIVYLSDDTEDNYSIDWSSPFEEFKGSYILLLKGILQD